jgi:hypothetical protein
MKKPAGGKGANLAEMCLIKLPVPAGFTITTECCTIISPMGAISKSLKAEVEAALAKVEKIMGMKFGDKDNPLLVSCRSGPASPCRHEGDGPQRRPRPEHNPRYWSRRPTTNASFTTPTGA